MTMGEPNQYVGRFAPSPTGPLHFGSLVAATASYLQARSRGGKWIVRIEDIDPPREQPGASDAIIAMLKRYAFEWDGPVLYQSHSAQQHADALNFLIDNGHAYRCGCSRKDLIDVASGALGSIYPGTCRNGTDANEFSIRVRTDDSILAFHDGLQGKQSQCLASESGDFIIRRRDELIAYQLAVVVDDQRQGITEIVRGIDIMDSTPRQLWLQQLLGYNTPHYRHIPVITHANGDKLSKLTGAAAIPQDDQVAVLYKCLEILRQDPPAKLRTKPLPAFWDWAVSRWNINHLDGIQAIVDPA